MCNQGIHIFPKAVREYAYFLKFQGTHVFPGFGDQEIRVFPKLEITEKATLCFNLYNIIHD